jgi:hypothetical protein
MFRRPGRRPTWRQLSDRITSFWPKLLGILSICLRGKSNPCRSFCDSRVSALCEAVSPVQTFVLIRQTR